MLYSVILYSLLLLALYLTVRYLLISYLTKSLREGIGMPVPRKALCHFKNRLAARSLLKYNNQNKVRLNTVSSLKERMLITLPFADLKLDFFYSVCLGYISKTIVYRGDITKRRQDEEEEVILANRKTNNEKELEHYRHILDNNRVVAILDKLSSNKDMDTRGFLRAVSVRKLENQTNIYEELFESLKYEYEELLSITGKMNYILDYIRSCAYRNLYLGSELINIVRNNGGGGKLDKSSDYITIDQLNLPDISLNIHSISNDYGRIIYSGVSGVNNLFKDKEFLSFSSKNPKVGLSLAVIDFAMNTIEEYNHQRNVKIKKMLGRQKKLLKLIEHLLKYYQTQLREVCRSVELAYSIVHMNKGFIKIYAPIRDRVFAGDGNITKREIIELVRAMNDYNNTAKASL